MRTCPSCGAKYANWRRACKHGTWGGGVIVVPLEPSPPQIPGRGAPGGLWRWLKGERQRAPHLAPPVSDEPKETTT